MKSLRHFGFISFSILLCMIVIMSCFLFLGRIYPKVLVAREVGKPIVTHEVVHNNYLGINQIISTSDKVYIMHANYGIVSVYNNVGIYQYSISVYSHENGRVEIACVDDLLYVRDKQGNVYRFQEDVLLDFVPKDLTSDLIKNVDFETESREYFLKGASIYRQLSNDSSECVINRSSWLIFTQASVVQPLLIVCMFACFVCIKLMARKP